MASQIKTSTVVSEVLYFKYIDKISPYSTRKSERKEFYLPLYNTSTKIYQIYWCENLERNNYKLYN